MQSATDNNLTITHDADHDNVVSTLQHIAGDAPCHFTNGIYGRQNFPIRETLLAGFRYMMDIKPTYDGTPPVLVVGVNSDKSIADFNMMQNAPTYAARVEYLASALKLLSPSADVVFFPYDEETPTEIYGALKSAGIQMTSIHKHANYGRGIGFPKIPGAESFGLSACFPLLMEQQAIYESFTEQSVSSAEIVADLYSRNNGMGHAYLSADVKTPRIMFPAPLALLQHMGQSSVSAVSAPPPPSPV